MAQVGTVNFCSLKLILLLEQDHAGQVIMQYAMVATLQVHTTANILRRARNTPRFPTSFSAHWGKKEKHKLFLWPAVNLIITVSLRAWLTSVLLRHGQDLFCKAENALAVLGNGCFCWSIYPRYSLCIQISSEQSQC